MRCLNAMLALVVLVAAIAAHGFETPQAREERMRWWREARLGMFVHWGLYSAAEGVWDGKKYGGGVEWIQNQAGVPAAEYAARLRPLFKPRPGFARSWARLAKEMGARYVVFTSKHHEGFALHDSKYTDFDGRDFTGRDLFREIVEALRAEGLRVGLYHSVIDWHHPDFPVKNTGLAPPPQSRAQQGRRESGRRQGHEPLRRFSPQAGRRKSCRSTAPSTSCGGIGAASRRRASPGVSSDLMALVRKYQPNIIMNNRLYYSPNVEGDNLGIFDISKGDFTTPEQHIPATGNARAWTGKRA